MGQETLGQKTLYRGLRLRRDALVERINALREKAARTDGVEKLDILSQITQLERRRQRFEKRLQDLNCEKPGAGSMMKAMIENLVYDLTGAVENFILKADSGYRAHWRHDHLPRR